MGKVVGLLLLLIISSISIVQQYIAFGFKIAKKEAMSHIIIIIIIIRYYNNTKLQYILVK